MNDQTNAAPESETTKTVIRPDLNRYVRDKSGNGKRTHRTDDFIARTLANKGIEQIKDGATALGVEHAKWNALNIGQQRMLIGNKLRHFLDRTKSITADQVTAVFGPPVGEFDPNAQATGEGDPAPAEEAQPESKGKKRVVKKAN